MPTKFDRMISNWGDLASARSLTLRDLFGVRQQGFNGAHLKVMPISGYKNQAMSVRISAVPGDIIYGGTIPWFLLEASQKYKTYWDPAHFMDNIGAPILFLSQSIFNDSRSCDVYYITGFNRKSHDPFMFLYDSDRSGRIYMDDGVWRHDEHLKSS